MFGTILNIGTSIMLIITSITLIFLLLDYKKEINDTNKELTKENFMLKEMNKYYLILIKQMPLECYVTYRNRIYSDFELDDLKKDIVEILSSGSGVSDIKVIRGMFLPVKGLFDKKENRDG